MRDARKDPAPLQLPETKQAKLRQFLKIRECINYTFIFGSESVRAQRMSSSTRGSLMTFDLEVPTFPVCTKCKK